MTADPISAECFYSKCWQIPSWILVISGRGHRWGKSPYSKLLAVEAENLRGPSGNVATVTLLIPEPSL